MLLIQNLQETPLASHGPLLAAGLVAWALGVLHPVPSTDIG